MYPLPTVTEMHVKAKDVKAAVKALEAKFAALPDNVDVVFIAECGDEFDFDFNKVQVQVDDFADAKHNVVYVVLP